jgi:predicted branched-subunit amino acid permease
MTTNAGAVNHREEFRRGLREIVEPSFGISAWALVTGVAMIKSGLSVPLATLMSLAVYAGSAQLAALPLMAAGAPLWVVWAAAFCMNLRFVIFSAHWRKYFGHFPRAKRLALLGLAYSTLSGRNSWVAALVAAAAAVAAFHLPLKLNIVVAIAAGVAAGMLLDRLWPDSAEARR